MQMGLVQVLVVMGLVCWAAVLATPPGRLPLALRGLQKMLRKDRGLPPADPASLPPRATVSRRVWAFVLVVVAFVLAQLRF